MLEAIIRRVPFFADLPPRHVRWLAETLQPVDILAGAVLFSEGDRGDSFYIIIQGQMELVKALEDGSEELLSRRGPSEYVGEVGLLHPGGPRTVTVRAVEDSELLVMTRADFDALLHRHPSVGYELARVLSERLEQANVRAIQRLEERNRALQAALDELHAAQAELVEKQKLEHELALARESQMSLLPHALPALPGFDFGARLLPMSQVGGDFYDFIPLDDRTLGIAVGDVSGHGIPAALIMAITLALLRARACPGCAPSAVLAAVNQELLKLDTRRMFVTVLYGVLDLATGDFTYARAGHESPVLALPDEPPCLLDLARGRLMGLFADIALADAQLSLPPGGSLVLYTDGVVERRGPQRAFFGEQRLVAAVAQVRGLSAQAICDGLLAAVEAFDADGAPDDDITVLCVRRLADSNGRGPAAPLRVAAALENLKVIRRYVAEQGARAGFSGGVSSARLDDLVLAVDEAATNIILHGYGSAGLPGTGVIEASVVAAGPALSVTLRDQAPPFDPTAAAADALPPLKDRGPGGLGIFLIRKSVDDFRYRRTSDGWNELMLAIHKPAHTKED